MKTSLFGGAAIALAALALGGCSNYGGRGYSRVSLGYGYPHRSYYGWYDDYYYPGAGYYLYDRYGTRHRWNDGQRRYWEGRRDGHRHRENWSGYHRDRGHDGHHRDRDHDRR